MWNYRSFEKIPDYKENKEDNIKLKIKWIKFFKIYTENKSNIIEKKRAEIISELIQNYSLYISNYIKYIEY